MSALIEDLKRALKSRTELRFWAIVGHSFDRPESYLMRGESRSPIVDQEREVNGHQVSLRLAVPSLSAGMQGEAVAKVSAHEPLDAQIDRAIASARLTAHKPWSLPSPDSPPRTLPLTADPRILEDPAGVLASAKQELQSALKTIATQAEFNSAEIFVSAHRVETHLSSGHVHREQRTKAYFEAAFSMPGGDEFMQTAWMVGASDLRVAQRIEEIARNAERTSAFNPPKAGRYRVLIHQDALASLLHAAAGHLSASHSYRGLPFKAPGSELIPGARGELLSMRLDPTLELGPSSGALSGLGIAQSPLPLVDRNRVTTTVADPQHAQYLGIPVTTTLGNLVVEPGPTPLASLLAPGVLEIVQFSGLFVDPASCTFSSEIRLGVLHGERPVIVKGGSVSGSVFENFTDLKLSAESGVHCEFAGISRVDSESAHGFLGPKAALLNDVSVSA